MKHPIYGRSLDLYGHMLKNLSKATGQTITESHGLLRPIILAAYESQLDDVANRLSSKGDKNS